MNEEQKKINNKTTNLPKKRTAKDHSPNKKRLSQKEQLNGRIDNEKITSSKTYTDDSSEDENTKTVRSNSLDLSADYIYTYFMIALLF